MSGVVGLAGYAVLREGGPPGGIGVLSRVASRLCQDGQTSPEPSLMSLERVLFNGRFGVAVIVELAAAERGAAALDIHPSSAFAAIGEVWSTGPDNDLNAQPAAAVLRRFVDAGGERLTQVNGQFACVSYDDTTRTVTLCSDRLGLHALYYHQEPNLVVFSTSIQSLLEHDRIPRELSNEALGQLLYLGFVPGDHTYLSGVQRLPSGAVVTCSSASTRARRYWDFHYPAENGGRRTVQDYAEECYGLLRSAAKRMIRQPHKTGVLLSGGLDSRVTLGTLVHEFGPRMVTCTYGLTETADIRTARKVAAALSCRHEVIRLAGDTLPDLLNSLVVSDFLLESRNAQGREVMRSTRPLAPFWYSGYLLDATFGGYWLADDPDGIDSRWLEERILDRGTQDERFQAVVGAEFGRLAREAAIEGARKALASFPETTPEKAFERFMISFRHRGFHIASHAKYAPGERNFLMSDNDLFEFFLRLPVEMRRDKRAYVHMLKVKWPELGHVPYGNTGAPVGEAPSEAYLAQKERSRTVRRIARRLGLGGLLGPSPYLAADKAFTFAEHPEVGRFIQSILLSDRALSRPHVDPDGVTALAASLQRSASGLRLLFRLLRTELLIRSCFEGDRTPFGADGVPWHAERRSDRVSVHHLAGR